VRVVTIANQKGGVGKTTVSVNLAAALGRLGKQVLVIDMDPQANATDWLNAQVDPCLWDLFVDHKGLAKSVTDTGIDGIHLIPGCPGLVGVERALANDPNSLDVLKKAIKKLPEPDFILIDTPPSLGMLLINALVAADEVIVPVETRALAVQGLGDLIDSLEETRERINPKLDDPWILMTRKVRTRLSREIEEGLRERMGSRVLTSTIREAVRIAEAPAHHKTICDYAPESAVADDFKALAAEVVALKEN